MKTFIFTEKTLRKNHTVLAGAPCEWSSNKGATHTLNTGAGYTLPAILKKTRLLVGVDENASGEIQWETWIGKTAMAW